LVAGASGVEGFHGNGEKLKFERRKFLGVGELSAISAGRQDIVEQYIAALNTREPDKVVSLYSPTAVHVTSARTVQGIEAIRAWYQYLFTTLLPGASITLTGYSGTGSSRHLTWTATSQLGNVNNGSDTFGLFNEKIAYHYTFFTLS